MSNTQKMIRILQRPRCSGVSWPARNLDPGSLGPSIDGLWSVVIVTEKGTCDAPIATRSASPRARCSTPATAP